MTVRHLVETHFPQVHEGTGRLTVISAGDNHARVHLAHDPRTIRPGGTISGPTMFKLADFSVYAAILAMRGEAALQAVTTNLAINFLARPAPAALIADARLLRLGRRLTVGEVEIRTEGSDDLVAHATATYAMP